MYSFRFAPSPTGGLHIGSVRTALFNYLAAKHYNGKFLLRIEDTDLKRSKKEFLDLILLDLKWLGLNWDNKELVFQSKRLDIYKKYIDKLLKENKAYYCFCTKKRLAELKQKQIKEGKIPRYDGKCRNLSKKEVEDKLNSGMSYTVRLKLPENEDIVFKDLILGEIKFNTKDLDDFIILKSDGYPSYNFAVVIDDYLMGITHILRGQEHISNTPKQILVYKALGFSVPEFGHIPIILDENKKKLSKREGATYLRDFVKQGYLKEAVFNYLALLGFPDKLQKEILTKEEIISQFNIEDIFKHNAVFDVKKMIWYNSQYINLLSNDDYIKRLIEYLKEFYLDFKIKDINYFKKVALLYKERIKLFSEFLDYTYFFFYDDYKYLDKAVKKYLKKQGVIERLEGILEVYKNVDFNNIYELEDSLRNYAEDLGVSAAKVIHPVRVSVTGMHISAGLFEVLSLLGKDRVLQRIEKTINKLKKEEL